MRVGEVQCKEVTEMGLKGKYSMRDGGGAHVRACQGLQDEGRSCQTEAADYLEHGAGRERRNQQSKAGEACVGRRYAEQKSSTQKY
jgi:hypothetical protein